MSFRLPSTTSSSARVSPARHAAAIVLTSIDLGLRSLDVASDERILECGAEVLEVAHLLESCFEREESLARLSGELVKMQVQAKRGIEAALLQFERLQRDRYHPWFHAAHHLGWQAC